MLKNTTKTIKPSNCFFMNQVILSFFDHFHLFLVTKHHYQFNLYDSVQYSWL